MNTTVLSLLVHNVDMNKVANYELQSYTTGTNVRFDIERKTDSLVKIEMKRPNEQYRHLYGIFSFEDLQTLSN